MDAQVRVGVEVVVLNLHRRHRRLPGRAEGPTGFSDELNPGSVLTLGKLSGTGSRLGEIDQIYILRHLWNPIEKS